MAVRAKFQLWNKSSSEQEVYDSIEGKTVKQNVYTLQFGAVTGGSEENKQFFASTPTGQLQMSVVREEVANQFTPGKEYYLDIFAA